MTETRSLTIEELTAVHDYLAKKHGVVIPMCVVCGVRHPPEPSDGHKR